MYDEYTKKINFIKDMLDLLERINEYNGFEDSNQKLIMLIDAIISELHDNLIDKKGK